MSIAPRVYPDAAALADGVARALADAAAAAAPAPFRIALCGGTTPRALFTRLAGTYRAQVDWRRWHVFWGDERCVAADDAASNYHMARAALLEHVPIPPQQIFRMPGELPPARGAAAYEALLRTQLGASAAPTPLDVALQGVGDDGHTASLFPGDAALAETSRWAVPVHVPHVVPPQRLSMTLPLLAGARTVLFVASGAGKAAALAPILADPVAAAAHAPAARLHVAAAGRAHWHLDAAAAGRA